MKREELTAADVTFRTQILGAMGAQEINPIPVTVSGTFSDGSERKLIVFPETSKRILKQPERFEDFVEGDGLKRTANLANEITIGQRVGSIKDILMNPRSRRLVLRDAADILSNKTNTTGDALTQAERHIKLLSEARNLESGVHEEMNKVYGVCRLDAHNPLFQAADFILSAGNLLELPSNTRLRKEVERVRRMGMRTPPLQPETAKQLASAAPRIERERKLSAGVIWERTLPRMIAK